MKRRILCTLIITSAVLTGLASCTSSDESAMPTKLYHEDLPQPHGLAAGVGRRLFVERCESCHDLPVAWHRVEHGEGRISHTPVMGRDAWMTLLSDPNHYRSASGEERQALTAYLLTRR